MVFEPKISGVTVRNFDIKPLFNSNIITINEVINKDLSQKTMNFILDSLRFWRCVRTEDNKDECIWRTSIDMDTNYKLAVLEKPEYEEYRREFVEYFGENWMSHYIRFNH